MKMKRFTTIFFLSTIMIFMCLVPFSIARRAVDKLTEHDGGVNIDWEKLYPFEESRDIVQEVKTSLIQYIKEKVENYTSHKLAGSHAIIGAAKSYEEFIGWNMAAAQDYNPVIKLSDGYLAGLVVSKDITENANAVKELSDFCRSLGIDYLYVNYPAKICVSQDKDISGMLDFSNQNADNLLYMLRESGVRAYDLREILHNEGMNHHEAFFRTDHHWRPETGLWAARHILEILRDIYGWNVKPEILNPDSFEYKVYPEWFLGSQGTKLTLARTKPDDFTMIYPKFSTHLRFEILSRGIDVSGDFSIFYEMSLVERKDYSLNTYAAYKYADQPLDKIHNLLNHNGKKLLIIHDSMSNCVIPFIALDIENIDEIDLRHFTGSVRNYITSTRPDAVITAYHSGVPGRTLADNYPNNKLYDFR